MLNITDVDAFTTVQHIADGDALDGTNHATEMQTVANRTRFLLNRVHGAQTDDPIRFPFIVMPLATGAGALGKWGFMASGSANAICQADVGAAYPIYLELTHPKEVTLTELSVTVCGASGHGALPGTMPMLKLYRQDPGSSGAPTLVDSQVDTAASTGAYEVPHSITLSGLSETLTHDGGSKFYVELDGEGGANSAVGLQLLNLRGLISP